LPCPNSDLYWQTILSVICSLLFTKHIWKKLWFIHWLTSRSLARIGFSLHSSWCYLVHGVRSKKRSKVRVTWKEKKRCAIGRDTCLIWFGSLLFYFLESQANLICFQTYVINI
jgi:hypothetical protein